MSNNEVLFPGKLAVLQRVLPSYRVPFFEELASRCDGGFTLFAGQPRPVEAIQTADALAGGVVVPAHNRHIFSGGLYLCYQHGVLDWLESQQPDALVVEANPRYPSTPQAIRWMRQRGKPVLGWGLGAPPIGGRLSGLRTRRRVQFLSLLDGVISYSERGAAEYRDLGLPPEKVFVAHNAAAHAPTTAPPERPAEFESGTVLFVGRLQARKRLEMLFTACAALPPVLRPRVVIVGDGPARQLFEDQAAEHYPSAEFVGAKHGEELAPYYAMADLFVLPGTGGLAVQQAMAAGLPVVVAQGDGTQNDLVRPENGWLIPPDDQQTLNRVLVDALSNPARLRQMGEESYRITAEEINLEQMAIRFVGALHKVS